MGLGRGFKSVVEKANRGFKHVASAAKRGHKFVSDHVKSFANAEELARKAANTLQGAGEYAEMGLAWLTGEVVKHFGRLVNTCPIWVEVSIILDAVN